jgi:beta-glucosidase
MAGKWQDSREKGIPVSDSIQFPDDFVWGTATASYQVEGATEEDGRGVSIWDTFCRTPGKVFHGDTGDIACDQYHRLDTDVDLMAGLNLGAYRFSVAWPRVQPDGSGKANQAGLDYYRRVVDTLRSRGIAPAVTLYHWDLPQALQEAGGWANRDTAARFADYVGIVAEALGDGVDTWITLNEPWVSAHMGYARGTHAPGQRDLALAVRAAHHLLVGHGLAVQALRGAVRNAAEVGITLNLTPVRAESARAADAAAAERVDQYSNRWFLDPVLKGEYPAELLELYRPVTGDDFIFDGDLELINAAIDFLGINFYRRSTIAAADGSPAPGEEPYEPVLEAVSHRPPDVARTTKGWPIEPDALTELLLRVRADYGDIPLYITENGAAFYDYVDPEGRVKDPERIDYVDRHLRAAHEAISAGVNLRGYFYWSLLDNFEWADGYSQRFGLIWVDYGSQERIVKDSGRWFAEVARTGKLPAAAGSPSVLVS